MANFWYRGPGETVQHLRVLDVQSWELDVISLVPHNKLCIWHTPVSPVPSSVGTGLKGLADV